MLLLDASPLLYALREDVPEHDAWRAWLEDVLNGDEAYSACNATLTAVVRISTSHRVFKTPTPLDDVFRFIDEVRDAPRFILAEPGPQHWALVEQICRGTGAKGNLVSDVYLAALALELGAELITPDSDFARFPRLRFRNPVAKRRP